MDTNQMGLGFPRPIQDHQLLIGYIVANGYNVLRGRGVKIAPEPRTDHTNHHSRYSDVGFIVPSIDLSPKVIIEISGNRKSANYCRKRVTKYSEEYTQKHYVFSELFHWDMVRDRIDLYLFNQLGNVTELLHDDYSRYLGIHLWPLGADPYV